jgi:uncharacterized protein YbaR (Trm112 family)
VNEHPNKVHEEKPFDRRMLEALVCPQTHGALTYDADRQELISKAAHLAFPIRNGIPVMLIDEARNIE